MYSMKRSLWILVVFLLQFLDLSSQDLLPKPNPPRQVVDVAGVLSENEIGELERLLDEYDKSTSNQIEIVTIPTLDGYPIDEYANKLYRSWGIGQAKKNNGVLIIAAINDRKLRIEVGYGLEGAIPDITANHIIDNDLKPNFKNKQYFEGFRSAVESIKKAATGEYVAPENYRKGKGKGSRGQGWVILIVIIIIFLSRRFRGGGGLGSRGGFFPPVFWSGGGGSSWSSSSDSGGGFDFGGGSSGGGGASGDW